VVQCRVVVVMWLTLVISVRSIGEDAEEVEPGLMLRALQLKGRKGSRAQW
jgi:hypothetical protein